MPMPIRADDVEILKNSLVLLALFEDKRMLAKIRAIMAPIASIAEWKGK